MVRYHNICIVLIVLVNELPSSHDVTIGGDQNVDMCTLCIMQLWYFAIHANELTYYWCQLIVETGIPPSCTILKFSSVQCLLPTVIYVHVFGKRLK